MTPVRSPSRLGGLAAKSSFCGQRSYEVNDSLSAFENVIFLIDLWRERYVRGFDSNLGTGKRAIPEAI